MRCSECSITEAVNPSPGLRYSKLPQIVSPEKDATNNQTLVVVLKQFTFVNCSKCLLPWLLKRVDQITTCLNCKNNENSISRSSEYHTSELRRDLRVKGDDYGDVLRKTVNTPTMLFHIVVGLFQFRIFGKEKI